MFLEDGTPVRATLSCTFLEVVPQARVRVTELHSADVPRTRRVTRTDTLASIAAQEYGDPGLWREIARANRRGRTRGRCARATCWSSPAAGPVTGDRDPSGRSRRLRDHPVNGRAAAVPGPARRAHGHRGGVRRRARVVLGRAVQLGRGAAAGELVGRHALRPRRRRGDPPRERRRPAPGPARRGHQPGTRVQRREPAPADRRRLRLRPPAGADAEVPQLHEDEGQRHRRAGGAARPGCAPRSPTRR